MKRTLEARKNNAHTTILLIEGGKVIGEWFTTQNDEAWASYRGPGDLADWEPTCPDETDPEAYGELLDPYKLVRDDELVVVDANYAWSDCSECGNTIKFGPGAKPTTACPGCGSRHTGDRATATVTLDYIPSDAEFYAESYQE